MIFMSESGLLDLRDSDAWDRWYEEHLKVMVTAAGIQSAQRFRTECQLAAPSLAMYSVESAEVFQNPYYLGIRGMGPWKALIDPKVYRRVLFDGMQAAPQVTPGEALLVWSRDQAVDHLNGIEFTWLKAAGLDSLPHLRGIAVASADKAQWFAEQDGISVYFPSTARYTPCPMG